MPTLTRASLSFCEPTAQDMQRWLDGLPKANLGETARLLYQAMSEFNQLRAPAESRMPLLELLRPEIDYVCKQLERYYLNQPIVLSERPRKIASLCQALQNNMAIGYKLVAVEVATQVEPTPQQLQLLAAALQRAIQGLFRLLVRASQLYTPTPDGVWLELHHLYALAKERELQHLVVADRLAHHVEGLSVEQSYIAALLLGCANCNRMRQQSIARLAELLDPWSVLVHLQPARYPTSLFCFSPQTDGPPRYRSLFKSTELNNLFGIDPQRLVEVIEEHLKLKPEAQGQSRLPAADGLSVDLLQQLSTAWGDISERTFQRTPSQGDMTLCIGMSALHYFIAGKRTFNEVLQRPDAPTSAVFKLHNIADDIWAKAFDAKTMPDENAVPLDSIEFVRPVKEDAPAPVEPQESYPTYTVQLVNHSPGGYCLAWPDEVPVQLQAGELLGLQDARSKTWSVALVRWIRQVRGSGPQMGIEIIAPRAQPCGLRLLRKVDQGSEYLRALLLPAISAISRPASLIAPRPPFHEGHKVLINQNGEESRAMLRHRQTGSGSYNQFEYQLVGTLPAGQPEPSAPADKRKTGGPEDFDSLWKSL